MVYVSAPDRFASFRLCNSFTADAQAIVVGETGYQSVVILDYRKNEILTRFSIDVGWLTSFVVSPDGTRVAGYRMDKETGIREIVIYDGATGAELNRFSAAPLPEDMFDDEMEWLIHGYPPGRIGGFLKDNRRLVYSDDHVVVLDTESGVKQVITPTDGMTFSFAPESETVAVPRANEDIEIRDLNSVAVSVSFHGHGWETLVTLSRDGRQMLIPGAHSFTIWDTETGAWVKEYEGISDDIQGLAFSPSGTCVITYGQENTVQFWDLTRERDRESRVFLGEDGRDSGLRLTFDIPWPKFVYDFNSEISLAAFANQSGDIGIWEVPSFRMVTS